MNALRAWMITADPEVHSYHLNLNGADVAVHLEYESGWVDITATDPHIDHQAIYAAIPKAYPPALEGTVGDFAAAIYGGLLADFALHPNKTSVAEVGGAV